MFTKAAQRLSGYFARSWKRIICFARWTNFDAFKSWKKQKDHFEQHLDRDACWEATEASNRYRHVEGGQNEEEVMAKGKPKGKGKPIFPAASSKDGNKGPKYPAK
jgi:hypothetical protein